MSSHNNKRLRPPPPGRLARGVLKAALEAGAVAQPARCELCGTEAQTTAHQAAPLDAPLSVVWLCAKCRAWLRRAARAARKLCRIQEILKEG